jgi:hypothetical protein
MGGDNLLPFSVDLVVGFEAMLKRECRGKREREVTGDIYAGVGGRGNKGYCGQRKRK